MDNSLDWFILDPTSLRILITLLIGVSLKASVTSLLFMIHMEMECVVAMVKDHFRATGMVILFQM